MCRKFNDTGSDDSLRPIRDQQGLQSHFGNGTARLEPQLKKVPGTVPSGKPPEREPYHAVEKRYKPLDFLLHFRASFAYSAYLSLQYYKVLLFRS